MSRSKDGKKYPTSEKEESNKNVSDPNKDKAKIGNTLNSKSKIKPKLTPKQEVTNVNKSKTVGRNDSSRVSKSVFFPTKNMYKNALETKVTTPVTNKDVTNELKKPSVSKNVPSSTRNHLKTLRTKSPHLEKNTNKISIIKTPSSSRLKNNPKNKEINKNSLEDSTNTEVSETSEASERPRTATLKKGTIVNENIVGPNIPVQKGNQKSLKSNRHVAEIHSPKSEETESNYEDDFETYESDFEHYSSSSSSKYNDISGEETSTSSVTSEEENDKLAPMELQATTVPVEERLDSGNYHMPDTSLKVPYSLKQYMANVNPTTNEILRNNPASLSDEGYEEQKSLQFVNFLDAKKRYRAEEKANQRRKRGEHILSMIKLDKVNFTLFSLPPVPYDVFIKTYGKRNTIQSATQTGDENINEETQTDIIECASKGTQFPFRFSKSDEDSTEVSRSKNGQSSPVYDDYTLNKFMLTAGNLIIRLQEESFDRKQLNSKKDLNKTTYGEGYLDALFDNIDNMDEVIYQFFLLSLFITNL